MRMVTLLLVLLLAVIQYPLWFGHGGWLYVHE
ncbi:MAG: cell division protein FtsB, partial [Pandoraea sp.]|nr:cell division protein FtsB [Pandoraea sp.]